MSDALRQDQEKLARITAALESEEFACPGGHFDALWATRADALLTAEYDAERRYLKLHRRLLERHYLLDCPGTITVRMEYESDDFGGSLSEWPEASGLCAALLGLDEDQDYEREIWARHAERRRLWHVLMSPFSREAR